MPSSGLGAELGHYRIIRELGRGGMGVVYLARDQRLERHVAIKVLAADRGDTRPRLLREARAIAAIDHPNICAVYEVGETADGQAFIVMQHLEGETLAAMLQRGPLPPREALVLAAQIAEALAAAHGRGIIHRDLKPQNVIVTAAGRARLLDFGLSKEQPDPVRDPGAVTRWGDTLDGVFKGTPAYMSPEQIQQRPIDGRSDLFALGVMLFECLTGHPAFAGATTGELFGQILYVHPPPVSSLRPELTERHDELCCRLLAKDPADRFQSADEVIGALRLLTSDSSRNTAAADPRTSHASGVRPMPAPGMGWTSSTTPSAVGRRLSPAVILAAILALVVAAGGGWWFWSASRGLPPAPADARRWYDRGTEALRDGAYLSGKLALQEALRLHPQYPLAHARLAEALAGLDDERGARDQLLLLSADVPDQSRLSEDDRLRLQGTRALVLRDLTASLAAYRTLAERHAGDATAWLDLGRAQEAAEERESARASYARAIQLDPQYAAARLRFGVVAALESRRDEAMAAYSESERLYRAAANTEGVAEVLLRRGQFHYVQGNLGPARTDLERALDLGSSLKATYQVVRARLALGGVTAAEGNFAESERVASDAVRQALDAGLDTTAADGLIDLAATLSESGRPDDAAAKAEQAIQLAELRGAPRPAARARIQLAAVRLEQARPRDALALADRALAFVKPNSYRRYELLALSVMSRAYQQLDQPDRAIAISTDVVAAAESLKDDFQAAIGLSNLGNLATSLGQLPQALAYRERAEAIRRRQHDVSALPYDLANRAELLIRLGRDADASRLLDELETGIKAGIDAYVGRARRAAFLRGLAALTLLRPADALRHFRAMPPAAGADSVSAFDPLLVAYAEARLGRRSGDAPSGVAKAEPPVSATLAREWRYWRAAAFLAQGRAAAALADAENGLQLTRDRPNDEVQWRLAAIAAAALQSLGEPGRAREMSTVAAQTLERLRSSWPEGNDTYERRPDLAELNARLTPTAQAQGGK